MMRTRVRDWLLRLCFALIRWLQDEPAQTLQPGDVVWCRMPLAQGQLENIPAAHQIRPYVVCQEDEQGIQAYACSSHPFPRVNERKVCRISGSKYGVGRDTYVDTSRMWKIPGANLYQYYFRIDPADLERISRCRAAKAQTQTIGVGCVVRRQDEVYYIYAVHNGHFQAFAMHRSQTGKGLMVSCHSVLYALELSRTFSLDLPLQLLQQFSLSEISRIARAWRKHQRQEQDRIDPKDCRFDHPVGQMFSLSGTLYFVYLYSLRQRIYGIRLDEEGCTDYRLHREKHLDCLKPEKICTFEDLQDAVAIMQEDKVLSEEMACALLRRRRDGC